MSRRKEPAPSVKLDMIMIALDGAGIDRRVSHGVAYSVAKMPTNGIRNQSALSKAISERLAIEKSKLAETQAGMAETIEFVRQFNQSSERPALRLIQGGRQ